MANKKNSGIELKGVLDSLQDDSITKETSKQTINNINDDIIHKVNTKSNITSNTNSKIILKKKTDTKQGKKAFNVYMQPDLIKKLDKISKESGYSRNELINIACNNLVDNVQIVE